MGKNIVLVVLFVSMAVIYLFFNFILIEVQSEHVQALGWSKLVVSLNLIFTLGFFLISLVHIVLLIYKVKRIDGATTLLMGKYFGLFFFFQFLWFFLPMLF